MRMREKERAYAAVNAMQPGYRFKTVVLKLFFKNFLIVKPGFQVRDVDSNAVVFHFYSRSVCLEPLNFTCHKNVFASDPVTHESKERSKAHVDEDEHSLNKAAHSISYVKIVLDV